MMTKKSLIFINDFWAHFKEKIVKKAFKKNIKFTIIFKKIKNFSLIKRIVLPNSHFFTKKNHTFSREFTNFHTFLWNLFFLPVWLNKAKNSLSWAFSQISFVLKTIYVTSFYRKNKRFFVKKLMREASFSFVCRP
jgi:hypothetical protein